MSVFISQYELEGHAHMFDVLSVRRVYFVVQDLMCRYNALFLHLF